MRMNKPVSKFASRTLNVVLVVLGLAVCGAIFGKREPKTSQPAEPAEPLSRAESEPPSEPPSPASVTVITIKASTLFSTYQENEVAADEAFKGKLLKVTGKIETIGKDITGDPYLALSSGEKFGFMGVQAMFEPEDAKQLAGLAKGQTATVRCVCDGMFGNVILRECSLR